MSPWPLPGGGRSWEPEASELEGTLDHGMLERRMWEPEGILGWRCSKTGPSTGLHPAPLNLSARGNKPTEEATSPELLPAILLLLSTCPFPPASSEGLAEDSLWEWGPQRDPEIGARHIKIYLTRVGRGSRGMRGLPAPLVVPQCPSVLCALYQGISERSPGQI